MQPLRFCRLMTHIGGLSTRPLSLVTFRYAHVPCRLHSTTLPLSCLHQPPHLSCQGLTLRRAADAARPQCPCRAQDKLPKSPHLGSSRTAFTEKAGLCRSPPLLQQRGPRDTRPLFLSSKCRPNHATTLAFLLPFHHLSKQSLVPVVQQKTARASLHHRHQWPIRHHWCARFPCCIWRLRASLLRREAFWPAGSPSPRLPLSQFHRTPLPLVVAPTTPGKPIPRCLPMPLCAKQPQHVVLIHRSRHRSMSQIHKKGFVRPQHWTFLFVFASQAIVLVHPLLLDHREIQSTMHWGTPNLDPERHQWHCSHSLS